MARRPGKRPTKRSQRPDRRGCAAGRTALRDRSGRIFMVGKVLERLGIDAVHSGACGKAWIATGGRELASLNPANGSELARVRLASKDDYESVMQDALEVFERWR